MSGPLAIAAVTATLKNLINRGVSDLNLNGLGSFIVSSLPPDRVTTGDQEQNRLNLFLYQITPNQGWRNVGLPSRDGNGGRLTNPPLALDLHYLLTAYGAGEFSDEVLLGCAMQTLHETPGLSRQEIRDSLTDTLLQGTGLESTQTGDLLVTDLADQIEVIKITPHYLNTEELSKLWTAMQARYRPTMAYQVSVVLIEGTRPARTPLPVLKRGKDDHGVDTVTGPAPLLTSVAPPNSQPAIRLGEDLAINGRSLNAEGVFVRFTSLRFDDEIEIPPVSTERPDQIVVHLADETDDADAISKWVPGFYAVSLVIKRTGFPQWTTNEIPVAVAPVITVSPVNAAPGDFALTVTCRPRLRPGQRVLLLFGDREVPVDTITTPADESQPTELVFQIASAEAGSYVARLRVDGADSLPIVRTGSSFEFDPQQKVTIA